VVGGIGVCSTQPGPTVAWWGPVGGSPLLVAAACRTADKSGAMQLSKSEVPLRRGGGVLSATDMFLFWGRPCNRHCQGIETWRVVLCKGQGGGVCSHVNHVNHANHTNHVIHVYMRVCVVQLFLGKGFTFEGECGRI